MEYKALRMSVVYEHRFARPMFSVARVAVEVLEGIYEALSPEYAISMADLSAASAATMSEVAIRANLFGGNGFLEVNPERFHARFVGIQSNADIQTIKNTVVLAEAGMQKALNLTKFGDTSIQVSAWLTLTGGDEEGERFFEKYVQKHIAKAELDAERAVYLINANFSNDNQGWRLNFLVEPSRLPGAQLFLLADATYSSGSRLEELDAKVSHLEAKIDILLKQCGLVRELD